MKSESELQGRYLCNSGQTRLFFSLIIVTNRPLRFDFYVDNKYLIEFDGQQHYVQNPTWGCNLEEVKYRDEIKNQWCKENNIPLIRIPYWKLKNLKLEDLLLS